ncbi:MAG: hypothetical protein JWQ91_988 [Aeromicrobium sp.]|jgi:hypothetical protein|uniref:hypothetical protein n=1 Tax=Aeromicrobium sp. TaxID=1871063 RepID=UPI00260F6A26|nr:hypothetical protein [Aeromicrobium sp.]MCW2824071.1 hypothetical protein [Aeromicrobium sp.]
MSEIQDHQVDLPAVEPTGHAQIDAALERLDRLADLEITSHPEEFDAIHGVLRESLANAGRDGIALDSP